MQTIADTTRHALITYVSSGDAYRDLNNFLRGSSDDLWGYGEEYIRHIDGLCCSEIFFGQLYRGVIFPTDVLDSWKAGDTLYDPAFLSTSIDLESAERFCAQWKVRPGKRGALITIEGPITRGCDVNDWVTLSRSFAEEQEVILPRETTLEITNIDRTEPMMLVTCRIR